MLRLPVLLLASALSLPAAETAIAATRFIADVPPTLSSHASTLVDTPAGLLAAWFGGTAEKAKDVVIWLSRFEGGTWSKPAEVARGDEDPGATQCACWNPVLWQQPDGPLVLFYKVGPSPDDWWGRLKISTDGGRSWGPSRRLPTGQVGPVRNKPVLLRDGTLLCGASSEDAGWRIHMEMSRPPFTDWKRTGFLNSAEDWGAIQPTIFVWAPDRIQILVRTRQKVIAESWSTDAGATWSPLAKTHLPNPNSAIDGVLLRAGAALLVYNPDAAGRATLSLASSPDGRSWKRRFDIETTREPGKPDLARNPAELSYPAIIQSRDGLVHVTYTWKRERIRHVVIDPAKLAASAP